MSDVSDDFKALQEINNEIKKSNLENANRDGWTIHTKYHWSRIIKGKQLNYWPSKNKFQYDGIVMRGDVLEFIKTIG